MMMLGVIFVNFVQITLLALQVCMFGRAIMSWMTPDEDNKLAKFLYMVTEPIVYPIRNVINKIEYFSNIPIDVSFIIAVLILYLCTVLLPVVN